MKRFNLISFLFVSIISVTLIAKDCCRTECTPSNSCDCEITSRSFLAVRPDFQSVDPKMISGFRSHRLHERVAGKHGTAEAVLFGSQSTNKEDLARYFFPSCKTELIVDEQVGLGAPPQPQDLLAQHFNIFTQFGTFRSKISIRPQTSSVGVGFYARKGFCINEEKGRGFFTSMSFPVVRIKNDLKFQEDIINDGGGGNFSADENVVENMTQALNQSDWQFGKITRFAQHKTGVGDIELKVGYEWIQQEPFHLESYLGILVPTGNKFNGEYLFEPIVGQGHHWGIMFGNSIGVEIWSDPSKERTLRVEYAGHSQYLFRNIQCRSLDLVCKPWSRYIEVYRNEDQAVTASTLSGAQADNFATPGINVLTIPLKVRPGFSYNMTTAAIFNSKNWQLEGGYNVYTRQSECVKLECPWQEGPAIKNHAGEGNTNPVRDITGNARLENIVINTGAPGTGNRIALGDYKFNYIKESDLDLNSATSPCIISHMVYVAGGYNWKDRDIPLFANVGGSYEFSNSNNAVVERWSIWGKFGLSF